MAEYEDGDGSSFQPGEGAWKAEINTKKEGKRGRNLSVGADPTSVSTRWAQTWLLYEKGTIR